MKSPFNILIISTGFPPRNVPGALRAYSWAKYWSRAGHKVTVLTNKKSALDGPLDYSLKNDSQNLFRVYEVNILPSKSFNKNNTFDQKELCSKSKF
jgi:hypothetical protein